MAKKTIAELLAEAKQLRIKEKELKAQVKAQKQIIAVEYADNLSPEAKAKQIAEAEQILNTAKQKALDLKAQFKTAMHKVKEDVTFAKEILDFVNYKQMHSLPRRKYQSRCEGNFYIFGGEGLKEIRVDFTKPNWKKVLEIELQKQSIQNNGARVIDNITYKAGKEVETHLAPAIDSK